mmetsp:Transcript_25007/g.38151  ORF Transcript_25007/g.38151 Transcript_25007/m.38151 type:complete len:84 (-) Transcript_25007:54-305(-)
MWIAFAGMCQLSGTLQELEQPGVSTLSISMCHRLSSHGVAPRRALSAAPAELYFNDSIASSSRGGLIMIVCRLSFDDRGWSLG